MLRIAGDLGRIKVLDNPENLYFTFFYILREYGDRKNPILRFQWKYPIRGPLS